MKNYGKLVNLLYIIKLILIYIICYINMEKINIKYSIMIVNYYLKY